MELVGVLGGFDPNQQGDGGGGVLVVNGRIWHAHHHHVILPHPSAWHGWLHDDVQQDVSWRRRERYTNRRPGFKINIYIW